VADPAATAAGALATGFAGEGLPDPGFAAWCVLPGAAVFDWPCPACFFGGGGAVFFATAAGAALAAALVAPRRGAARREALAPRPGTAVPADTFMLDTSCPSHVPVGPPNQRGLGRLPGVRVPLRRIGTWNSATVRRAASVAWCTQYSITATLRHGAWRKRTLGTASRRHTSR
jgi:hypothetical protein